MCIRDRHSQDLRYIGNFGAASQPNGGKPPRHSSLPQGFVLYGSQWESGPFVIAGFGMDATVIAGFTIGMDATVIAGFAIGMDATVIAGFAVGMDTAIIPRFIMGAAAS